MKKIDVPRKHLFILVSLLALLSFTGLARAGALLPGFDEDTLARDDDGSTSAVPLGFTADFFGIVRSSLYVNNNGNITFNAPLATFTPFNITSTHDQIIAPFFADVDTRSGGSPTKYGAGTLGGFQAFGVTWNGVNYYNSETHPPKLDSFQVIIINRSDTGAGNFDFEFNYNSILWETGSASGGTNGLGGSSARVGYSNGTGVPGSFYEFPGSGVPGSFLNGGPEALISHSLNSATPGRYIFSVRNGAVFDTLTTGYWLGNTDNKWFQNNWAENATGSPTFLIPGATTDVVFSATGARNQSDSDLNADFTIKSLTVDDPTPVVIEGANTLTLSGTNATTGLTGINVKNTAGPVSINTHLVLDGASETFLVSNAGGIAVNGLLSGTGAGGLLKLGPGTLTLTNPYNNYAHGTHIGGGTITIASDAVLGAAPTSPAVNITFLGKGGTLQLASGIGAFSLNANRELLTESGATAGFNAGGGSNTFSIPNLITGAGGVAVNGSGSVILSASNDYTGGTTVEGGTLLVNNPHALGSGNVTVNGGVLASDPQPINVGGNYTQSSGGSLQLRISGTNAAKNDTLNVKGRASLGGNAVFDSVDGFQPKFGQQVTVITANGGVSGKFDTIDGGTIVSPTLVYESRKVILERLFATVALTPNQFAVARTLDGVVSNPKEAALLAFLNNEPANHLPGDFDLIAPADLSSLYEISFAAANVQQANLESRLADVRNGSTGFSSALSIGQEQATEIYDGKNRLSYDDEMSRRDKAFDASPSNRWGIFVSGQGDFVHVDGDFNAKGYDFTSGGTTLGVDFRVNRYFTIGAAVDYAHTWTDLSGNGRVGTDSGKGGIYATIFKDKYYVNAYAGGGYNNYDTRRTALQGDARGNTDGGEFNTFIDGGYEAHIGDLTYGPITSFQYSHVGLDSFTESGSLAPLSYPSQSQDSLRTDLGMKAYYVWKLGAILLTPQVGASWQHEFDYSALPFESQFASGAGNVFTVNGPSIGRDSALLNAGVTVDWNSRFATYLDYDGKVNGSYQSHTVSGGAQFTF